jgi:hypothetical protein
VRSLITLTGRRWSFGNPSLRSLEGEQAAGEAYGRPPRPAAHSSVALPLVAGKNFERPDAKLEKPRQARGT